MNSIGVRHAVSKGVKDSRRSLPCGRATPETAFIPHIVETPGGWEADPVHQISAVGRVNSMIRGTLNG
jgi:hypothetical protein